MPAPGVQPSMLVQMLLLVADLAVSSSDPRVSLAYAWLSANSESEDVPAEALRSIPLANDFLYCEVHETASSQWNFRRRRRYRATGARALRHAAYVARAETLTRAEPKRSIFRELAAFCRPPVGVRVYVEAEGFSFPAEVVVVDRGRVVAWLRGTYACDEDPC